MNVVLPQPKAPGAGVRDTRAPGATEKQRYVGQELLASGGGGVVYRVLDIVTGETRALKRLTPFGMRDRATLEAFEREYHVLAGITHPRIIRVYDYGIDEEGPYYTMEFVDGGDLRAPVPVPYKTACFYLRDVATSLALLHARRLLHRDVSPRNVRTTADGHCKLLDFGALSNFGKSVVIVGTPPAIPPETLEGTPLDQRADLYSLGALAYWLLTGEQAFPARNLDELPDLWNVPPRPPSSCAPDVPDDLDALVLSLLHRDPRARPGSAAEVIARLNVIGELSAEDTTDSERLAESFLLQPQFTGRAGQMAILRGRLEEALEGRGGAVCVRAMHGLGRTRLLEEIGVRAQLAGATVVRVDASMHRQLHGSVRALVLKVLDALPGVAGSSGAFRKALAGLGADIEARLGASPSASPASSAPSSPPVGAPPSVEAWFSHVSRTAPLVVEVDDIEDADHGSLGVIAGLAKLAPRERLLVVVAETESKASGESLGLQALHAHTSAVTLDGLSEAEMLELVRSLFADAPYVERFADWLHERTAGGPLHALEICRQLVASQIIRYSGGVWTLPVSRPDLDLPAALEEALSARIDSLGAHARSLAECLSLQRELPTFDLCKRLSEPLEERKVIALLDELARNDVLHREGDGYQFSSTAVRDALLHGMDEVRLEQNHRKLGEAFAALAGAGNSALKVRAGFHLIRGGVPEGADLIASVARDSTEIRTLMANLHRVGEPLEAALGVYRRQRRSAYERMPLLSALAQAGYYEDRKWGERYGDEALSVVEDLSGVDSARRLGRFCGRFASLFLGIVGALVRYAITPRRERPYPFVEIIACLLSTATTLAGAASASLDPDRARRVADALSPFSVLPERLTPVGIYRFCRALQEIGRENEAEVFERLEALRQRFDDPRFYPTLPVESRRLYVAAAHFSQASMGVLRADGKGVLESADALDRVGFRLYTMIASQLRFLYHMNRGEFASAEEHRRLVELHAAQVGSLWQVETWESPALILVYTGLFDVVNATRVAHRLEAQSREVPALRLHYRLAKAALQRTRREVAYLTEHADEYARHVPRSYIGWAATMGYLAQAYNEVGRHEEAKQVTERTLAHVTDADRDYSSLFLNLDIQNAIAIAALGDTERAVAILDGLLHRFEGCDHPLVKGFLHEARARIAWSAGQREAYERSLAVAQTMFRGTGTPILIARGEELGRLGATTTLLRGSLYPVASVDCPTLTAALPESGTVTGSRRVD